MRFRLLTALSLTLPLATACPSDDGDVDSDSSSQDTNAGGASVKLVSFNLALAFGYIEEASARVDPIIAALSASDADVVCLQELWVNQNDNAEWTTEVIDRVLGGTTTNYPHQYMVRTTPKDDTPVTGCTVEEAEPLEACATMNCGDEPPENLSDCILEQCSAEFGATAPGCQSCLAANLGQPLDAIVAACKGVTASGVVYDSHNGLAILSKHPLSNTSIAELDFALTARSILHATVTTPQDNTLEVYCTHLAADLTDEIAYPEGGTYTTFAEENAAQTTALLELAGAAGPNATVALMGDFNQGPSIGAGTAELEANYQSIISAGYADPIADEGVECTFCNSNTLNSGGTGGKLIDHIFVTTPGTIGASGLVFDEAQELTSADGTPKTLHISDHYGLETTISF